MKIDKTGYKLKFFKNDNLEDTLKLCLILEIYEKLCSNKTIERRLLRKASFEVYDFHRTFCEPKNYFLQHVKSSHRKKLFYLNHKNQVADVAHIEHETLLLFLSSFF